MRRSALVATMVAVGVTAGAIKGHTAEVGVLVGGWSKHHTTRHAPANGYNENHHTIGIEFLNATEGFAYGGSIARFDDSFGKKSKWVMGIGEYIKRFKHVSVSGGLGLGYLGTSYYNGAFGALYGKLKHNGTGVYVKVMHQPVSNHRVDSFTAVTTGIGREF